MGGVLVLGRWPQHIAATKCGPRLQNCANLVNIIPILVWLVILTTISYFQLVTYYKGNQPQNTEIISPWVPISGATTRLGNPCDMQFKSIDVLVWLVVWLPSILFSHDYWECHHPNWRTIFFRGVAQPPTSCLLSFCWMILAQNTTNPAVPWANETFTHLLTSPIYKLLRDSESSKPSNIDNERYIWRFP